MIKYVVIVLSFVSSFLLSNITPEGFERFPNYYFVETGTYSIMTPRNQTV